MNHYFKISHTKEKYCEPVPFHSHDFYEIYFFVNGNVRYYIEEENYDLSKGNILIIPPGKLHRPVIKNDLSYDRYVLWIFGEYTTSNTGIKLFLDAINQEITYKKTRLISFEGETFPDIVALFNKLLIISGEKHSNEFEENSLTPYLCDSYNILILEKILNTLKSMKKLDLTDTHIIRQVISYINCNITDAPSLDTLSSQFFISKYYLSRQFKEYTKMTIHQYILSKKINLAKELLEHGKNPQQVCNLCGFSTYSNFYKVFTKQTGKSPREFMA